MIRQSFCSFVFLAFFFNVNAQFSRYIVSFSDKGRSPYTLSGPLAYLSQRAVDRRLKYAIPLDSADLPVTPTYIDSVKLAGTVTLLNASKWLNSVTIQTSDSAALNKIGNLPFVKSVSPVAARIYIQSNGKFDETVTYGNGQKGNGVDGDFYSYGNSFIQVHIHNGEFLHNIGLHGENMIIGFLDGGFRNYTSLHAFDSVNANGQVLGIFDFVAHDNSVIEDDPHGMECFSIVAANLPGKFIGTAPKASFYLFRTEDVPTEYPVEEHNWVCGAERLDSAGGDLISSSLGYTTFDNSVFNHTYADLNGHTTMAAIGATMAAKKGILVATAAGNDGNKSWHFISTPADADSIMTVGAVASDSLKAFFSSFGPSSDGRIKPDLVSMGLNSTIETTANSVGNGSGTSFATPNLAGLSACLWQGFREFNNMHILRALKKAGSLSSSPNDSLGFGIPDMKKAVLYLLKDFATSSVSVSTCSASIQWTSKDMNAMKYEIERQLPGQGNFAKIAEFRGSGTVFFNHNYQYSDDLSGSSAGNVTYRIREIIDTTVSGFTADYITSASAAVQTVCTVGGMDIKVIPDPATGTSFNIRITTPDAINTLQLRVLNMLGQSVYVLNTSAQAGINDIPISINGLSRGKYLVTVYSNGTLIGIKQLLRL